MRKYFKTTETIEAIARLENGKGLILTKTRDGVVNDEYIYNRYMFEHESIQFRDSKKEVVLYGEWKGKHSQDRYVTNFYTIEQNEQLEQDDFLKLLNAKKITKTLTKSLNFPEHSIYNFENLKNEEIKKLKLMINIEGF